MLPSDVLTRILPDWEVSIRQPPYQHDGGQFATSSGKSLNLVKHLTTNSCIRRDHKPFFFPQPILGLLFVAFATPSSMLQRRATRSLHWKPTSKRLPAIAGASPWNARETPEQMPRRPLSQHARFS